MYIAETLLTWHYKNNQSTIQPNLLRIDCNLCSVHEEITSIRLYTLCNPRSSLRKGVYNLIEVLSNEPNTNCDQSLTTKSGGLPKIDKKKLTFLSRLWNVPLPFTKRTCCIIILKRMQLMSLEYNIEHQTLYGSYFRNISFTWILKKKYDYWWKKYWLEKTD
jgi:hypothetical protein